VRLKVSVDVWDVCIRVHAHAVEDASTHTQTHTRTLKHAHAHTHTRARAHTWSPSMVTQSTSWPRAAAAATSMLRHRAVRPNTWDTAFSKLHTTAPKARARIAAIGTPALWVGANAQLQFNTTHHATVARVMAGHMHWHVCKWHPSDDLCLTLQ